MIEPLVIEHEGKPTHVLLRFADWERIRGTSKMPKIARLFAA